MRRRQKFAEIAAAIATAKAASPAIVPHDGHYAVYAHPSIPKEEIIDALVNLEMTKRRRGRPKKAAPV